MSVEQKNFVASKTEHINKVLTILIIFRIGQVAWDMLELLGSGKGSGMIYDPGWAFYYHNSPRVIPQLGSMKKKRLTIAQFIVN